MNKTQSATAEKIRELVPRLKELRFGCKILYEDKVLRCVDPDECIDIRGNCDGGSNYVFLLQDLDECEDKDGYEIIGHPITLVHVRDAIREVEGLDYKTKIILMTSWIEDTFDEQEDSFKEWIASKLIDKL